MINSESFGLSSIGSAVRITLPIITFLVPVLIMKDKSATYDEVAHLPAGYTYLTTGIIKLNQKHPPLIKEICAFPLLFLDIKPLLDKKTLQGINIDPAYEWNYGRNFLYHEDHDADRVLFWGRVPALLLSVGLAVLVGAWSKRLWGEPASFLALFLYAFDPTITAHAQLVTTDVGFAFFATLFLFLLRRYLESPSRKGLILSGLFLGLALGTKFSAVVLIPMLVFLVILAAWKQECGAIRHTVVNAGLVSRSRGVNLTNLLRQHSRPKRMIAALAASALMILVALSVLWLIYIFPTDPFIYFKGLKAVNKDHDPNFLYYLMGELKPGGWRTYFLIAWLVKTPIPSLLLLAAATLLFFWGNRAFWLDEAFLVIPGISFFIGYSLAADNMGVRYLIPCFPFIFIFTARVAGEFFVKKRSMVTALAILLGWYFIEFVTIYPDHLSYFNEIAGGSRHGPEWLDDSNVDWGQGLIQLRHYLQENPPKGYWFCYFGSAIPKYYGISGRSFDDLSIISPPLKGTIFMSAHCVARARAIMNSLYGSGPENWISHTLPKAIVGHAYYVYEIEEGILQ
ncbi:MAG: hypothetical protein DMG05_09680 [Acidobacteria bacterium]|nr:MAG: hypothetical protein DMG05_09680 [Acidobacteriota bacterium]